MDMEDICTYIEERTQRWVSDGLENDFREWNHHHAVLIDAQTGRGKNHFIMEKLIPYAWETGQQVLIFSNRVALSTQQKKLLFKKFAMPMIYTDNELRDIENFGPVTILNYQSALKFLAPFLNQTSKHTPIGGFPMAGRPGLGYVVFDEAHFFLSDATFNADTQRILESLVNAFSYYTRIYLTATPDNIVPIITFYEQANEGRRYETYYELSAQLHKRILPRHTQYSKLTPENVLVIYKFPQNYSDYNLIFFSNIDFLYEEIQKASKDNKWLLFINSKARQREISAKLKELLKRKKEIACFNAAKKGDEKVWNSLMEGKLPVNVFLTTRVLDNGVNISDLGLKNIVIEFEDKISFLQMLGRKRRIDGEQINVFVLSPSQQAVKERLIATQDLLSVIQDYRLHNSNFLQRRWKDLHQEYRNLFWVNDMQQLECNKFAEQELNYLLAFYSDLLFQMQNTSNPFDAYDIYPKLVLRWLGCPGEIQWLSADAAQRAVEELKSLLEQHLESVIPEEQTQIFFNRFKKLGDKIYSGKKTITNDSRSKRAIIERTLDDFQQQLGAHYKIAGKGKSGWTISKE